MTRTLTRLAAAEITPPARQFQSERLCSCSHVSQLNHSLTFRSRKALLMTETQLGLIAVALFIWRPSMSPAALERSFVEPEVWR
jgi:hypothetical protein